MSGFKADTLYYRVKFQYVGYADGNYVVNLKSLL